MAFVLADRVKESCTSPGTGTATLLGAATGYQSFSAAIGANNNTYYVIADQNNGANWEVGYGTIGAGGTTLARTTVLASSNAGSLTNFASGTQDVWCDYPAKTSLYTTNTGSQISLQAQPTDSTTTGGNARGANAVDWQTARSSAGQVASAQYAVIAGGTSNTGNGFGGFIGGGSFNTESNTYAVVVGGSGNSTAGYYGYVGGGGSNQATGYYNFIGAGYANTGTANAAVTTQSSTMNGTTAVTLGASNASIKVGQYISGTYISSDTYVAAVSGTSLTLSKVASGSGTATLSFYTPHGVVVGGGNNQATGSYAFIGGGGDAGTAANRNVASGDWSAVVGGKNNTASGQGAFIGGGGYYNGTSFPNLASGAGSFIGGGFSNTSSGFGTVVAGGNSNTANGSYSFAGGLQSTNRTILGAFNYSAGVTSAIGDAQWGVYALRKQTTDATPVVVTADAGAAGTTNQVILPDNSAYYFKVSVIAGVTGAGNTKAWTLEGAIKRGVGVGTTAIVGTVTTNIIAQDAGAATWTVTATADTTNGGLKITATGQASTTIRWVAQATTTEMTF